MGEVPVEIKSAGQQSGGARGFTAGVILEQESHCSWRKEIRRLTLLKRLVRGSKYKSLACPGEIGPIETNTKVLDSSIYTQETRRSRWK